MTEPGGAQPLPDGDFGADALMGIIDGGGDAYQFVTAMPEYIYQERRGELREALLNLLAQELVPDGAWAAALAIAAVEVSARQADQVIEVAYLRDLLDHPEIAPCLFRVLGGLGDLLDVGSVVGVQFHASGSTSLVLRIKIRAQSLGGITDCALKFVVPPFDSIEGISSATAVYHDQYEGFSRTWNDSIDDQSDTGLTAKVPEVYGSGSNWILMQFVRGKTLAGYLQIQGQAPGIASRVELAKRIAGALCGVLTALHEEGMAHLDLSPDNILISTVGDTDRIDHMVLLDFGENFVVSAGLGRTREAERAKQFVAPELFRASGSLSPVLSADETLLADSYGLGRVLLEVVEPQVSGLRDAQVRILYREQPRLSSALDDLTARGADYRLASLARPSGESPLPSFDLIESALNRVFEYVIVRETEAQTFLNGTFARILLQSRDSFLTRITSERRAMRRLNASGGSPIQTEYTRWLFIWLRICAWAVSISIAVLIYLLFVGRGWSYGPATPPHFRVPWAAVRSKQRLWSDRDFWGRVVALSFVFTVGAYYKNIFSQVTFRGTSSLLKDWRKVPIVSAEITIRSHAFLWMVPLLVVAWHYPADWPIACAIGAAFTSLNNFLVWYSCRTICETRSRMVLHRAEVDTSDLEEFIGGSDYSEWAVLMLAYALFFLLLWVFRNQLHDWLLYAVVVVAVNYMKLYRSNCTKLAGRVSRPVAQISCGARRAVAGLSR